MRCGRPRRARPRGSPRSTARTRPGLSARRRSRYMAASATRGSAWRTCPCGACSFPRKRSRSGWRRSTLDYRDSEQEAGFRARLREWLLRNARRYALTGDEYWARYGEWHRALYDAGFFGLSWPREYGGLELPAVFDVILDEELAAAGAPPRPSLGYLVTGLGHHASPELCRRFLPGMINGTERWCQGLSEPGAGSDLASLTTTPLRDVDDYAINGHKIWTSYSDVADWCLLLARTSPEAPRHKGISAFVISMHQPGIGQRPLMMISGVSTAVGQVLFDRA